MRRTRRQNFVREKLIYVVTGILVIVLMVLILGSVFGAKKDKSSGSGDAAMVDADNGIDIGEVKNSLKKDTIPELTELIQQYYTAMSGCDISTLEQIVTPVSDSDKDIIRRKKDYIESYNNIVVYSKLCPVDGCYLVFAGYDIKFKNEEAMVPGLETFLVKTSAEDNLYIYKGSDIEPELEEFIAETISSETVQALFNDVNERYVDALASSATLLTLMEGFAGDNELIAQAKKKAATMTAQATEKPASEEPAQETESSDSTEETTSTEAPESEETPASEEAPTETIEATQTDETVLVVANVNLRSSNDETAERLTTMIVGDKATRVSITDNGWSKVNYNGTEGYVKTEYVTTFKLTSDSVKPTTTINVRKEASETAAMAGQITPDTDVTRYAICDNGWSQISYDGGVGYVKTEYLTSQ